MTESSLHPSVVRNHAPITAVLRRHITANSRVLELGSGDGGRLELLKDDLDFACWQASDVATAMPALAARIAQLADDRVLAPLHLSIGRSDWPRATFDAVVTVNVLHIMHGDTVPDLFNGAGQCLGTGGVLCIYGPFSVGGSHISDGNARFDAALRASNEGQGIRDLDAVTAMASNAGFRLAWRYAMPANNLLLVFALDQAPTVAV
ncbi:MAG: DUF938 domain-containing protein [Pseudomonadota bacterium]